MCGHCDYNILCATYLCIPALGGSSLAGSVVVTGCLHEPQSVTSWMIHSRAASLNPVHSAVCAIHGLSTVQFLIAHILEVIKNCTVEKPRNMANSDCLLYVIEDIFLLGGGEGQISA